MDCKCVPRLGSVHARAGGPGCAKGYSRCHSAESRFVSQGWAKVLKAVKVVVPS